MFDQVVFLEEECMRRGREEAFTDETDDDNSLQASFEEGTAVGLARGFEVGYEIGVMTATCTSIMGSYHNSKLRDKCRNLLEEMKEVPTHNDVNLDIHNVLNGLRGSYRAILSLAVVIFAAVAQIVSQQMSEAALAKLEQEVARLEGELQFCKSAETSSAGCKSIIAFVESQQDPFLAGAEKSAWQQSSAGGGCCTIM